MLALLKPKLFAAVVEDLEEVHIDFCVMNTVMMTRNWHAMSIIFLSHFGFVAGTCVFGN